MGSIMRFNIYISAVSATAWEFPSCPSTPGQSGVCPDGPMAASYGESCDTGGWCTNRACCDGNNLGSSSDLQCRTRVNSCKGSRRSLLEDEDDMDFESLDLELYDGEMEHGDFG